MQIHCRHSPVKHRACSSTQPAVFDRLALAHPGLPPAHDDWRPDSFLRLDSQQDLRGGINCAPLLNRKRPVEGDPVHPQTYYISGVGSHPINFPV
ncbi:hypothetical protein PCASD_16071 [Puccinia coronata f. sp. avenae]|uniref:Uncharacterized protein n=1 Tax=Puccinia coronata f. sp. avenae TaxID=200324 RepID=A0A2N5SYF6_9BASI|nr:hypothetical protein PCASD_16071 [Puccinia coronata f. sp. avenae]